MEGLEASSPSQDDEGPALWLWEQALPVNQFSRLGLEPVVQQ